MDLNKLSLEKLKEEISKIEKSKEKATTKKVDVWSIGKNYCIRTVTMIQVGKLLEVTDKELVLGGAAWVADTGRWADFLKSGTVKEVEPFPDGHTIVGRGAIVDACEWKHGLLRTQK